MKENTQIKKQSESKKQLKFYKKRQDALKKINKKENQDTKLYNSDDFHTPTKKTSGQYQNNQDTLNKKTKFEDNQYLSPAKTTSSNAGTPFSYDSNLPPIAVKATKINQPIIVKVRVPKNEGDEFLVEISDDRPDTNLSNHKQGNHVSAYITFIHLLISAVEFEDALQVSTRILQTLENIIPSQEASNKELLEFIEQKLSKFTSRNERKKTTAYLKAGMLSIKKSQNEIDEEVTKTKNTIKSNNNYIIADITENAANYLLENLNKDEYMTIAKTNKDSNGGVEGPLVRNAINCLKTVDRIININNAKNDKEYKELVEDFIEDYYKTGSSLKSGLKRIMCPNETITNFNIDINIKDQFKNLKKTLKDPENPDIISRSKSFFNNLLFNKDSKEIHQNNIFKSVSNLFDFKHSENQALPNVEPILYKVTARHLAIIFNAFPNLKSLDNENRDYIKNNFLDFVLENQGWNEYLVLINGKPTPLNPDSFKKIIVSYLDEEYKMKPIDKKEDNKEMDNFPQLVFNQQDMTNNLIDRPSFGENILNISSNVTIKK
jgi:hypothetical protein